MTNTVSYLLFHRICRFCLKVTSESGELLPLFGTNQSDYGRFTKDSKESLPEIISSCIGLNVDEHDGLPVNICSACVDKLKASNSFRNLCLQSANTLQEIKLQHQYEQMGYESDDDEPLHLLKPPVMVFVDGIKSECDLNEGNLYNMDEHRGIESDKNDDNDSDYNDNNNDDNNDDDDDTDTDDSLINEIKQKKYGKKAVKRKAPSSSSSSTSPKSKIIPILPPKHKPTTTTTKITSLTITPFTKPSATSTAAAASKSNKQSTATSATTTTTTSSNNSIEPQSTDATQLSEIKEKPQKSRLKMPKQCTVCGLIVKRLRDHMKMHPEALEFKCQHCSRTYLTQNGLDRHLDTQHTESKQNRRTEPKYAAMINKLNKDCGFGYIAKSGILRPGKKLGTPCGDQCRMHCTTKITETQRQHVFEFYYSLANLTLQWQFLGKLMDKSIPKIRQRLRFPRDNIKRRKERCSNIQYNLPLGEMHRTDNTIMFSNTIRVCQTMFKHTFDISGGTLKTVYRKTNEEGILLEPDNRGGYKIPNL